ncbi:hypothetical protein [Facklamia sp. P12955]|uniref:hypothetical protein n=1 Tax=Facklamia sp. P12955 TaxID=3421946 RepID=UPI003D182196
MLQGIFNFIVGSVSYSIIKYNQFDFSMSHNYIVIISLLIAVIGLFVEVVGDEQLR